MGVRTTDITLSTEHAWVAVHFDGVVTLFTAEGTPQVTARDRAVVRALLTDALDRLEER